MTGSAGSSRAATTWAGVTRTLTYQYDRNGNRIRITHPDGVWFDTATTALNRPYDLDLNGAARIAVSDYHPHGGLLTLRSATAPRPAYAYDGVQRPVGA